MLNEGRRMSVEETGFERVGRLLAEVWRDDEPGAASSDGTPLPPPPRGYEILGRLGEGGMGSVWRARQLATRRLVALKLMHAGALGGARARARFEREVELTARLEHP